MYLKEIIGLYDKTDKVSQHEKVSYSKFDSTPPSRWYWGTWLVARVNVMAVVGLHARKSRSG